MAGKSDCGLFDSLPTAEEFGSTQWSVVLLAGRRASTGADEAMESLCRRYWKPLYTYARCRVDNVDEAQELTQAFFARVLERNDISAADPKRGRFRSFLFGCFRHFLANEWAKSRAVKRGGGLKMISLDFSSGESPYRLEPISNQSPERLFDRHWATTLIEYVMANLRREYTDRGKDAQFDQLKEFLTGRQSPDEYAAAAERLGLTLNAAQVAVHRMRRRYGELLRHEIARTVSDPGEIEDEIHDLFVAFEA